MISNREISRLFSLYAELLLLHQKDERLAGLLSAASYRIRNLNETVIELSRQQLAILFRPEIVKQICEIKRSGAIEALNELIQLTPQGLFEMMRIMYFDNKKADQHFYKPFERFEQLFPSVAKIITALKSKRYQDFPILLQRLEAQIILKEIALTVSNELPEAPLFTIHDSVLTTGKYRAQVKQIMIRVYRKHLGFDPAIEDKNLEPVSADLEIGKYCTRKLEEAKIPMGEHDVTGYLKPARKRLPFPTLSEELSTHVFMYDYYNPFA